MSQRLEFVTLASGDGANISELCERFGISRQTGYVWLRRFSESGVDGLVDRPRRPVKSPGRTSAEVERLVLESRDLHPAWGGRKLKTWLEDRGYENVPAASTITAILHRHGRISEEASKAAKAFIRFEYDHPNDLWQMDFKGPISTWRGTCQALTVLDDHSRFSIALRACPDQCEQTVRDELTRAFRLYGLPHRMLADNGSPWASTTGEGWTGLKVWLLQLGVVMIHGRPYHPQTQGKDERFHRTLNTELLSRVELKDVSHAQASMDPWRDIYNLERPHEALGMKPPASRYRASSRAMPDQLPKFEPGPDQTAYTVKEGGRLRFASHRWYLGRAWDQHTVALQPSDTDGVTNVFFGPYHIAQLDQNAPLDGERVRLIPVARCARSLHEPHPQSEPNHVKR